MSYQAQFGLAEESTWGTYVAPTRFFEFLPGESLGRRQTVLSSQGLRKGQTFGIGPRRVLTKNDAGGNITFEIGVVQFGLVLKHMLGTVNTALAGGGTITYDHTFTAGDLSGKSLTLQKGVEKVDGTVQAFSYLGSKITDWTISVSADQIAQLELTVDAKEESKAQSLATASFAANQELFHFGGATLEVDDVVVANVSDVSVSGTNSLNTERYHLGQLGAKKEPRANALRTVTGDLTAEFDNVATFYDLFTGDTSAKLEVIFTGSVIEAALNYTLHITCNDVRFTGETPKIEDPEVGRYSVPFEAFAPAAGEPISILYRTTDTTP